MISPKKANQKAQERHNISFELGQYIFFLISAYVVFFFKHFKKKLLVFSYVKVLK